MMLYKSECFGKLHSQKWNEDKTYTEKIEFPGQSYKTESRLYRCKEYQCYKQGGSKCCPVELMVFEGADLKERVLGAHIECLYNL